MLCLLQAHAGGCEGGRDALQPPGQGRALVQRMRQLQRCLKAACAQGESQCQTPQGLPWAVSPGLKIVLPPSCC